VISPIRGRSRCENSRRAPARRVCGLAGNWALAHLRRAAFERDSPPRSGYQTRQGVLVASTSIGREISPQTLTGLHPALASRRPRPRAQTSAKPRLPPLRLCPIAANGDGSWQHTLARPFPNGRWQPSRGGTSQNASVRLLSWPRFYSS
jgi:hypothetical protein